MFLKLLHVGWVSGCRGAQTSTTPKHVTFACICFYCNFIGIKPRVGVGVPLHASLLHSVSFDRGCKKREKCYFSETLRTRPLNVTEQPSCFTSALDPIKKKLWMFKTCCCFFSFYLKKKRCRATIITTARILSQYVAFIVFFIYLYIYGSISSDIEKLCQV